MRKRIRMFSISIVFVFCVLMCSSCRTVPYIPASSEIPYGFVKGDELHRNMIFDKKTGTYVKREKPEVVTFDFDGIAASYSKWKGRDSNVDNMIHNIGE
jgi:hypothetical protein